MTVKDLLCKARAGDISAIYNLRIRNPELSSEIKALELLYSEKIKSELEIGSSDDSFFTLREHLRGLSGISDPKLSFNKKPVILTRVSGDVYLSADQIRSIIASMDVRDSFTIREEFTPGEFMDVIDRGAYIDMISKEESFKGILSEGYPSPLIEDVILSYAELIFWKGKIKTEPYGLQRELVNRAPKKISNMDYLVLTKRSIDLINYFVKNNNEIILSGMSFVGVDGLSVRIREKEGKDIFDRVMVY